MAYASGIVFSNIFKTHDTVNDFVLSFVAIFLAIPASSFLNLHPSQIFIGTLALVLPGLTLTSAIGDLIEENFQTGLVRLAKVSLTLLSIGFAYMLATEIMTIIGFKSSQLVIEKLDSVPQFLASLASTLGMIFSFCVIFKVPQRAVIGCLFIGSCGWAVFNSTVSPEHPFAASFLASLVISLLARAIASIRKLIVQVYITPSILVLVPGLMAFSYIQPIVDEATGAQAFRSVLSSFMIAAAISFGLLIGQLRSHPKKIK